MSLSGAGRARCGVTGIAPGKRLTSKQVQTSQMKALHPRKETAESTDRAL